MIAGWGFCDGLCHGCISHSSQPDPISCPPPPSLSLSLCVASTATSLTLPPIPPPPPDHRPAARIVVGAHKSTLRTGPVQDVATSEDDARYGIDDRW